MNSFSLAFLSSSCICFFTPISYSSSFFLCLHVCTIYFLLIHLFFFFYILFPSSDIFSYFSTYVSPLTSFFFPSSPISPLSPPLAGLRTRASSPIKRASQSGLWCWVMSRDQAQKLPTEWDHFVVMETVSFFFFSTQIDV